MIVNIMIDTLYCWARYAPVNHINPCWGPRPLLPTTKTQK